MNSSTGSGVDLKSVGLDESQSLQRDQPKPSSIAKLSLQIASLTAGEELRSSLQDSSPNVGWSGGSAVSSAIPRSASSKQYLDSAALSSVGGGGFGEHQHGSSNQLLISSEYSLSLPTATFLPDLGQGDESTSVETGTHLAQKEQLYTSHSSLLDKLKNVIRKANSNDQLSKHSKESLDQHGGVGDELLRSSKSLHELSKHSKSRSSSNPTSPAGLGQKENPASPSPLTASNRSLKGASPKSDDSSSSPRSAKKGSATPKEDGGEKSAARRFFKWPSPSSPKDAKQMVSSAVSPSQSHPEPVGSNIDTANDVGGSLPTLESRHGKSAFVLPLKLNLGGLSKKKRDGPLTSTPSAMSDVDFNSEESGELSALPNLKTKGRVGTVDSKQLTQWLLDDLNTPSEKKMIILDMRDFISFNSEHITDSLNIRLPGLLVERYRRGSLQFLSMEKLLCSDEGKKRWRERSNQRIILVDDELPKGSGDFSCSRFKSTPAGSLTASIQKEMSQSVFHNEVFWLIGGFQGFSEYCLSSSQSVQDDTGPATVSLPNSRWIDRSHESNTEGGDASTGDSITLSTPNLRSLKSAKDAGSPGGLLTRLHSKLHTGLANYFAPKDEPLSPSLNDPLSTDYSVILPWLYLGTDPAVITTAGTRQSILISSARPDEISMQLPSPVLPSPSLSNEDNRMATSNDTLSMQNPTKFTSSSQNHSEALSPISISTNRSSVLSSSSNSSTSSSILHLIATSEKLRKNNIHFILNLANECADLRQCFVDTGKESLFSLQGYSKIGIYDHADEDVETAILKAISQLDDFHKQNPDGNVLVHCRAGKSRSATIVIAYIMKSHGWTLQQALEHVRLRRPVICPNIGFMSVLSKLEQKWSGK